jgi:hypothetical protein
MSKRHEFRWVPRFHAKRVSVPVCHGSVSRTGRRSTCLPGCAVKAWHPASAGRGAGRNVSRAGKMPVVRGVRPPWRTSGADMLRTPSGATLSREAGKRAGVPRLCEPCRSALDMLTRLRRESMAPSVGREGRRPLRVTSRQDACGTWRRPRLFQLGGPIAP